MTVTVTVPSEVWGALTSAALNHAHAQTDVSRIDLADAATAFVREALKPGAGAPPAGGGL